MVKPRYLADDTAFTGLPWIVYSALVIFFCFAVTLRTSHLSGLKDIIHFLSQSWRLFRYCWRQHSLQLSLSAGREDNHPQIICAWIAHNQVRHLCMLKIVTVVGILHNNQGETFQLAGTGMDGCETWKMTEGNKKTLDTFQTKCLRRIYKVFWPNVVSNRELLSRSNGREISKEVLKCKWD